VSACGRPPGWVQPRPTTRPISSRMTQPTAGLGQTRPSPRSARSRAARMCSMSLGLLVVAKLVDEGLEILRLAEIAIDRGEADEGDLVEIGERVHHGLADGGALNLVLAGALEAPH